MQHFKGFSNYKPLETKSKLKTKDAKVKAVFAKTDVTKWDQIGHAFDEAVSTLGRLDIVCAGAGIFEPVCSRQVPSMSPDS